MSSNLIKICPACGTENSASLTGCFRCGESIVNEAYVDKVALKQKSEGFERNWFLEELFTPTFWFCVPASIVSGLLAIFSLGTPFTPLFLLGALILGGLPFLPGDPVGDWVRSRIFAGAERIEKAEKAQQAALALEQNETQPDSEGHLPESESDLL